MRTSSIGVIEAHESFATKFKPDNREKEDRLRFSLSARVLRGTERKAVPESNPSNPQNVSSNLIEQSVHDPDFIRGSYRDLGSKVRANKRQTVIEGAHKSLARHGVSSARKSQHADLFQNRLRLDHATGKYQEVNWADPHIPIADVGIALERLSIPSLLLPEAVIYELRVSYVDPNGAAGLSKRIKVGDILLKVRILVKCECPRVIILT
jgi:hypothetical protein